MRLRSYNGLLVSFLTLIIVYPLEQYLEGGAWLLQVAMVGILVFAIKAVIRDRHGVRLAVVLGLPAVVGGLLAVVWERPAFLVVLTFIFMLCFLAAVILLIQKDIMYSDHVSGDTLRGAVCVYVLLGFVWALAYGLVGFVNPDAFNIAEHLADQDRSIALPIYFSFVTLTTLGFGDIGPVSPTARTLAWLEALVGQIYIAFTVARLVSMYIADKSNHER